MEKLSNHIVQKIADAMRTSAGKVSAPTGFEKWATEYFKQPACGEVLYDAPTEFTKSNPKEAIEWYEANVGAIPNDEKEVLLKTPR